MDFESGGQGTVSSVERSAGHPRTEDIPVYFFLGTY